MLCRLGAEAVLVAHLGFIVFATLGALLLWRWPRLVWLHLPALAWGLWIELSHGLCPLTAIENALRACAGRSRYAGGFIEHHLLPLIYPSQLLSSHQLVLASLLVLVNLVLYAALVLHRRPDRPP